MRGRGNLSGAVGSSRAKPPSLKLCEAVPTGRRNSPPPTLSLTIRHPQRGWFLRALALRLGFEGLVAAHINLNLLGLGFGLLSKVDLQHALVIAGAHLPQIHGTG